jgi:pyridoxine 4-dehydrogenase
VWIPALTPADLTRAVHDNLRNLGVEVLDVVNLRVGGIHGPSEGSIEQQFDTLAKLQRQGEIRHLGLSNVTSGQLKRARSISEVVCIQNHYNLAHRDDDALIDESTESGIAYVPFFSLGGFTPLQSSTLSEVATHFCAMRARATVRKSRAASIN